MTRTGIFGGSFNPIHNGHLALARYVVEQGLADEVWLMVSPHNPLKQESDLWDENLRLRLAMAATENLPRVSASDFEFHLPRPTYMWRTLQELEHSFPDRKFSLIIGADNWHAFPKWAHFQEILAKYPLLVYPREGFPLDKERMPANVQPLDAPLYPWSSTEIRHLLETGGRVDGMLPEKVRCLLEKVTSAFL